MPSERKKLILAIDDIVLNLHVIQSSLDKLYHVSLAKSTDMAMQILNQVQVDLILLDIEMPDMSGYAFLEAIRGNPKLKEIPVIFVSSHGTQEDIIKAKLAGADDFVVKPVQQSILLEKVRKALKPRSVRDDGVEMYRVKSGGRAGTTDVSGIKEDLHALNTACKAGIAGESKILAERLLKNHINNLADYDIGDIYKAVTALEYTEALRLIKKLLDNDLYTKA